MPATNPQTLLSSASCYLCYGMSLTDAMKLSLWDEISQSEGGCTAAPDAPINLSASGVDGDSFVANWDASAGATGYFLDVSDGPAFAGFIPGFNNLSVGNVTSFEVTGLDPSTEYYFRVRASNACGTSDNSETGSVTTEAVLPTDCLLCKLFASDLDGLGDGAPVTTWPDGSGNGNDAVTGQFATADTTIVFNQLSGRSAVLIDNGTDLQYMTVNAFLIPGAMDRTVYVVYRETVGTVQGVVGVSGSVSVGEWYVIQSRPPAPEGDPYFAGFGADLTGPVMDVGVWKMASVSYDGTDVKMYKDGALANSGALALSTNSDWFRIGGDGGSMESDASGPPDELLTGYIALVLVYCVAHDDVVRGQVEAWIREQYPALP